MNDAAAVPEGVRYLWRDGYFFFDSLQFWTRADRPFKVAPVDHRSIANLNWETFESRPEETEIVAELVAKMDSDLPDIRAVVEDLYRRGVRSKLRLSWPMLDTTIAAVNAWPIALLEPELPEFKPWPALVTVLCKLRPDIAIHLADDEEAFRLLNAEFKRRSRYQGQHWNGNG